jgi:hypothetical protein
MFGLLLLTKCFNESSSANTTQQKHTAQQHTDFAVALRMEGLIDLAILSFEDAVRISPTNATMLTNLGLALLDPAHRSRTHRTFEEGMELFGKAVAVDPSASAIAERMLYLAHCTDGIKCPAAFHHMRNYSHSLQIPRQIHQTWATTELPPMFLSLARQVRALHPEWEYRLWTDADIRQFVLSNFRHFSDAFFALPLKIMRIDMFRYMLMFIHGGVYLDLDYELFKPIDAFIADCDLLLPAEDDDVNAPNHLAQQLLASVPGHTFWSDVIRSVLELPPEQIRRLSDPVNDTGPHLVTRVHRRSPSKYAAKVPRRNFFCPEACPHRIPIPKESYGIHHCAATWREGAPGKADGVLDARWFDQPVF